MSQILRIFPFRFCSLYGYFSIIINYFPFPLQKRKRKHFWKKIRKSSFCLTFRSVFSCVPLCFPAAFFITANPSVFPLPIKFLTKPIIPAPMRKFNTIDTKSIHLCAIQGKYMKYGKFFPVFKVKNFNFVTFFAYFNYI